MQKQYIHFSYWKSVFFLIQRTKPVEVLIFQNAKNIWINHIASLCSADEPMLNQVKGWELSFQNLKVQEPPPTPPPPHPYSTGHFLWCSTHISVILSINTYVSVKGRVLRCGALYFSHWAKSSYQFSGHVCETPSPHMEEQTLALALVFSSLVPQFVQAGFICLVWPVGPGQPQRRLKQIIEVGALATVH